MFSCEFCDIFKTTFSYRTPLVTASDKYIWLKTSISQLPVLESFFSRHLTHIMPMLHLYRKQSIDLQWKSVNWFLYERNIGLIWVNKAVTIMSIEKLIASFVVFIVNLEHISHLFLVFLLLALNM